MTSMRRCVFQSRRRTWYGTSCRQRWRAHCGEGLPGGEGRASPDRTKKQKRRRPEERLRVRSLVNRKRWYLARATPFHYSTVSSAHSVSFLLSLPPFLPFNRVCRLPCRVVLWIRRGEWLCVWCCRLLPLPFVPAIFCLPFWFRALCSGRPLVVLSRVLRAVLVVGCLSRGCPGGLALPLSGLVLEVLVERVSDAERY